MSDKIYVLRDGNIKRKDNNVIITSSDGDKKILTIETLDEIYVFGELTLNTKLLNFLSMKKVCLHVFNYYGFYSGTFFPRTKKISGSLLVKQVNFYENSNKRLYLAKEFVRSAAKNIYRNLRYYNSRGIDLGDFLKEINFLILSLDDQKDIKQVMGVEGNIRKIYYETWNLIINQDINFDKRTKRPPENMINSLISFLNSLMYTTVLSEIYKTNLNPTISYLHEPGTKRFSLSLDIAEIFKPLIVDRMIFSILNKNKITESDFYKESNYTYLTEKGKRKILEDYDSRLEKTIFHKSLNRNISYRHLIRIECYKLIKHLTEDKEYKGFNMWW